MLWCGCCLLELAATSRTLSCFANDLLRVVLLQPVMLISNIVTGLAGVGLGFADSYATAIVCRVVGGLFNGSGV